MLLDIVSVVAFVGGFVFLLATYIAVSDEKKVMKMKNVEDLHKIDINV